MNKATKIFVAFVVFLVLVLPVLHWMKDGRSHMPQTITVTGSSQESVQNEVGQFYAGVTAVNDDKQAAITEVTEKMNAALAAVKEFGVADEDIKTQSVSVYQAQESVTLDGRQRTEPGQWNANNSIQIKLRDAARTSELLEVLTASGFTDVSGPNFMVDDSTLQENEGKLLQQAVAAARTKAEGLAEANDQRIVKVLSITEGNVTGEGPIMYDRAMGAGGSMSIQPGTSEQEAVVTVTFEVR